MTSDEADIRKRVNDEMYPALARLANKTISYDEVLSKIAAREKAARIAAP